MKYILFIDCDQTANEVLQLVDGRAVEAVYNLESWIENYPTDVLPKEFNIDGIEKFSQLGEG